MECWSHFVVGKDELMSKRKTVHICLGNVHFKHTIVLKNRRGCRFVISQGKKQSWKLCYIKRSVHAGIKFVECHHFCWIDIFCDLFLFDLFDCL